MGGGVLALEGGDFVDEEVDFVVFGLHLALELGVALLELYVLLGLGLAHNPALLAESLDLAAEHDDLKGKLVCEGFLAF